MSKAFWEERIVHLPRPSAFGAEESHKAELLRNVRYLLLVGSLRRPRRVAERLSETLQLEYLGTYADSAEHTFHDREFNIEVLDLGVSPPARMAIASHGIGVSGVEIVLVELFSLINLVSKADATHLLCGVGRSGTRGALKHFEYGTVGLSTASFAEDLLDCALPDPMLLQLAQSAATELNHPHALGAGVSTHYFWEGQGRSRPTQIPLPEPRAQRRAEQAQQRLWQWVERGIDFVEMEDHAVHSICATMGFPSVSAGAIIARRYDPTTARFILDYDADAKKRSELWPAETLVVAFQKHWAHVHQQGGPEAFFNMHTAR